MDFKHERYGRDLAELAVGALASVVVESSGTAREENFVFFFTSTPEDPEARVAGMGRQFGPIDLVGIFAIDLYDPPLVGNHVRTAVFLVGIEFGTVDKDDGIVGSASGMTEDGRAGKGSGLAPGIFLSIVDLHYVYRASFR